MKKATYLLSMLLTALAMQVSLAQDWPATDPADRPCYLLGDFRTFALQNVANLQVYKGIASGSPTTWTPILNTSTGTNVWSTDNNGVLCLGQELNLAEGQTVIVVNQELFGFLIKPLVPIIVITEELDVNLLPAATARIAQQSTLEEQLTDQHQITLYPNPVAGSVTLSYQLAEAQEVEAVLHTLTGQRVRTLLKQSRQSAGRHADTFQLRELPSGVYLCKVRVGHNQMQVLKLVKTEEN